MKTVSRQARVFRRNQPTGRESAPDDIPSDDNLADRFPTVRTVRGLLLLQVAGFIVLASIHFGLLIGGYRRPPAGATELVIVAALLVALLLTWGQPAQGQRVATAAQLLATLGALVGLFTMTLGVEPGTILEVALNVVLLLTVTAGLILASTWRRERSSR
jgi:hypothetical protein